jgi:signal transduction histidine kinase
MTAAEHGRNLTIATTPHQDGGVVLEIKDTGQGFINQSLTSIFDPFITTKRHGMGLGLALCRLIIQGHGGTITASHSSPSGAVFRIVLPAES